MRTAKFFFWEGFGGGGGGGGGGGEGGLSAVNDGIDHNRLRPQLHAQDCSSGILLSSRVSLSLKNYFSLCENIFLCIIVVEGTLKQEKVQR